MFAGTTSLDEALAQVKADQGRSVSDGHRRPEHERHLSRGQKAMAVAKGYPEGDKAGRGKKGTTINLAEAATFSIRRLQQARQVLHHSPALAKAVLAGTTSLDDALAQVKAEPGALRKRYSSWITTRAAPEPGQQAMAVALAYPEPFERGRGKKSDSLKSSLGEPFLKSHLSEARAVLAYSPKLAQAVFAGTASLKKALAQVKADQGRSVSDGHRRPEYGPAGYDEGSEGDGAGVHLPGARTVLHHNRALAEASWPASPRWIPRSRQWRRTADKQRETGRAWNGCGSRRPPWPARRARKDRRCFTADPLTAVPSEFRYQSRAGVRCESTALA